MDSSKSYLLFKGYHDVAAASDILSLHNITNRIVKAPISFRKSCSFAVLIDKEYEEMCKMILDFKGINMIKIPGNI